MFIKSSSDDLVMLKVILKLLTNQFVTDYIHTDILNTFIYQSRVQEVELERYIHTSIFLIISYAFISSYLFDYY